MQLNFTDIRHKLSIEYGVECEVCHVGRKVKRKIQHVKVAMSKVLEKESLSAVQWETLGDQIPNCANDTPLAIRCT